MWKRAKILEQVAFANISLAAVSTVVAAITGIYDNATRWDGRAENYQYKIVLAILLFLVTTSTSILRWRKPDLFEQKSTKYLYVGAYAGQLRTGSGIGFPGRNYRFRVILNQSHRVLPSRLARRQHNNYESSSSWLLYVWCRP